MRDRMTITWNLQNVLPLEGYNCVNFCVMFSSLFRIRSIIDKTSSQIIRLCQSSPVNWIIIIQTSWFLETSRHFDLFSKYFPICQIFPICQTFSYLHYLFVVWYKRRDRSTTKCISIENISSCGFVLCQYPQSLH